MMQTPGIWLNILAGVGVSTVVIGVVVLAGFSGPLPPIGLATTLGCAFLYILAHLLRGLRLFVLLYEGRVRVSAVVGIHLLAAAVGWLIPFKLGEVYRVGLIASGIRSLPRAVMVVWLERVCDALAVAGLILITAGFQWSTLLVLLGLFLFFSFFAYLVLPEWLGLFKRYLITRHNHPRSLRILAAIDWLHELLRGYKSMIRERWASLIWLSSMIWCCEIAILAWVVHAVLDERDGPLLAHWFDAANTQAVLWQDLGPTGHAIRSVTCDALLWGVLAMVAIWAVRRWRRGPREEL